jgi:catechol 2,3-dioxygenase-like lactoylglutathione lyase family enzyme
MIGRLNRVILFVKHMDECAKFYRDVLGLQPHGYADEGWKTFDAGGTFVSLHKHSGSNPRGRRPKHVQLVFKVDDVAATRAELIAKGAELDEIVVPEPSFSFCNGRDPEGNWFQVSSR